MNLNIFNTGNLYNAAKGLFEQLGIKLNSNTAQALDTKAVLGDLYKDRAPFDSISETYFAGLISDEIFGNTMFGNEKITYNEALQKTYDSLMIFAVQLNKTPYRTEISEITRAFNRKSLNKPVAVLFYYDNKISLSLPERFLYKQTWRGGEKVGKIIILKDISIDKPHAAHIRILESLKIDNNVRSFNDLHKFWQSKFSIKILNDEFYTDLQKWFYFAATQVKLPNEQVNPETTKNFLVRLLARTMFCWFIKEKGLIQPELLELSDYQGTRYKLTNDSDNADFLQSNSYYRGILQNIFFNSLNKKDKQSIKDFKWTKYLNKDFDISWLTAIPFLNGGIFDLISEDKIESLAAKESAEDAVIKIPNFLFYGKPDENEKGLNEIFKYYKFTLEENTPYEEDIALDPELLGLVFENLLAELDPNLEENTRKSIRKLTGSYYTPRKIISEMVNDSLFIYLKKHIPTERTVLLSDLIYKDEYKADDDDFCKRIVSAIDRFKVLDPACGSGAFPMGMLHKLVGILKLIDNQNEKWIELKLQSVDDNYRNEFKKILVLHQDDYSRKLGIIRDSIYGIDIQPLAVQITKLRFFISLLCDQKNESGITPMPNIETKIICADSLKNLQPDLFSDKAIEQLTKSRRKYYQPGISDGEKEKIANEIVEVLDTAFPSFSKQITGKDIPGQNKEKIREWFTHATVAAPFFNMDFFYPELKERNGFDCVIGNPPYGGTKVSDEVRTALIIESKDPYGAFIARFLAQPDRSTPLKDGGVLAFIVSDTFMTIKSHKPLRKQMMANYIHKMIRVHPDTFRATVNTAIIVCERSTAKELDKEHICEMADMTNVSIHEDYTRFTEILRQTEGVAFEEARKSISNPEYAIYYYPQQLIKTNSNLPFFVASPKLFALMNDGNDPQNKPKTTYQTIDNKQILVRSIALNEKEIEVVKLGDIADVKVGLQTGDNDFYLFQNPEARGTYRSINDYQDFVLTNDDLEKIRNNETLRLDVINNGISKNNPQNKRYFGGRYIIPYDKGGESDAEGGWMPNYYVPTNYFIDWSEWAIHRMKTLTTAIRNQLEGKAGGNEKLCSRFQNADHYFMKAVDCSRVGAYSPTYRIATDTVFDSGCNDIYVSIFERSRNLAVFTSKFWRFQFISFINHTVNSQTNDNDELIFTLSNNSEFENNVNAILRKQKSNPRYDYASHEQIEIDKLVYEAYGLSPEDVEEVENWYARRYPRLSQAQKQNLRSLGKSDDYLVLYGYKTEGK